MKLILSVLSVLSVLSLPAHAQTESVTKTKSTGNLTAGFNLPSGQTLRIKSGATLIADAGSTITGFGSGGAWGSITGTLSAQADLQTAMNLKAPLESPIFTGSVTAPYFIADDANSAAFTDFNAGGMVLHEADGHTGTLLFQELSADRSWAVPNASGTVAVSASGNIALSALGNITFAGTLPVANGGTGIASLGTGVATALGVNVGSAGAIVVNGGALGTPSSGDGSNLTNLPAANLTGTVADARIASTIMRDSEVSDVAYDASTWDGSALAPTRNVVRDRLEQIVTLVAAVAEVTTLTLTVPTAGTDVGGQYFDLHDGAVTTRVWIAVDNASTPPADPGRLIEVNIAAADDEDAIAAAIAAVLDADSAFVATAVANVVTITATPAGVRTDATIGSIGGNAALVITTQGAAAYLRLTALDASLLTALNASQLTTGTVATARLGSGTANSSTFLRGDGTWAAAGSGTVTSVAASVPAFLSVAGSPVTTSGTLAITLSGAALPVANGGTAATSAGIASFNNITGYTAGGATGTTSTNLVFSESPTITTPRIAQINDANGNEALIMSATASAVNEITLTNAATGTAPRVTASGGDSNIDLDLRAQGTSGWVKITQGSDTTGGLFLGVPNTWSTGDEVRITFGDNTLASSIRVPWTGEASWNGYGGFRINGSSPGGAIYFNATTANTIQFGGKTSAFPAIKRNSTELQARLADDSAFAGVQTLYDRYGSGSPEGVVTAPVGAIYHRTDGGAGTALYVKESGSGNSGWVGK